MAEAQLSQIGTLVANSREEAGLSQRELAHRLGTSQSAVARIERGEQNITAEMIAKISSVLNKNLINVSSGTVNFKIRGNKKLHGEVTAKTSKNAATALLAASLLNRAPTRLTLMPRIQEVFRIIEVLESIGVHVRWDDEDVVLTPPKRIAIEQLDTEAAQKTRSIIMLIAPLAHHFNSFSLPHVGGCKLGLRSIKPHVDTLSQLGISVSKKDDAYNIKTKKRKRSYIVLPESGDTVTENALLAAATHPGTTTIKYASANYQVQDLCYFLEDLGIQIDGIGTTTLTVHGHETIDTPITYAPSEDPTEAMFFIAAAATTGSQLTIRRAPIEFLELELLTLSEMKLRTTVSKWYAARNGRTSLADITVYPSRLVAPAEKIAPRPYPGLNIDNLPFFAVIATQSTGQTLIHDWVYEKRAVYYTELEKLGAETILADPHRVFIHGPTPLSATELICPPALRPATILLIAMLAAEGTSILRNVYSISRGYEDLVHRLQDIGADIELLTEG